MKVLRALIITNLMILIASCANSDSITTQYYQFVTNTNPIKQYDTASEFFIEPIEIPEILKRQAIVSYQTNKNNLLISNTHLWASDLRELISEVLLTSLQSQLPQSKFHSSQRDDNSHYHISIQIQEFSGKLGEQSYLQANWSLSKEDEILANHNTKLSIDLSNKSYANYVLGLNGLLIEFSEGIAMEISTIY